MTEGEFHGPYRVQVKQVLAATPRQRVVIRGSAGSDGAYLASPGLSLNVTGEPWRIELQFQTTSGAWKRTETGQLTEYHIDAGLVFTLSAFIGFTGLTIIHPDLTVTVTSRDPDLAPPHPGAMPPDFSLGKG